MQLNMVLWWCHGDVQNSLKHRIMLEIAHSQLLYCVEGGFLKFYGPFHFLQTATGPARKLNC